MVRGAQMAQPSHAEILAALVENSRRSDERLAQGSERFMSIETKLESIVEALEPLPEMKANITQMQQDIAATKELVEAWNAVKTGGKFVTWLGAITAALAAIWVVVSGVLKHVR